MTIFEDGFCSTLTDYCNDSKTMVYMLDFEAKIYLDVMNCEDNFED